jgi:general secretion pathway protein M
MMVSLRALFSKFAAIGILAGLVYGFVATIAGPIAAEHADLKDGIETQRALLGRLNAAASEAKAAQTSGVPGNQIAKGPIFLDGESDAIRIAGLQSKLGEAAQEIGARLSSTQAVQAREEKDVRLVGVQTQLSTTLEQLQKFIHGLETARPLLFVDSLHVSRGPDRDGQEVSDLDVRLVVLGATPLEKGQP